MTALREATQQALEALYQAREFTELYDTEHAAAVNAQCHENITALRAALEQQDERDWSLLEATQESLREHMAEIHRLRAALAQQAEPVAVAERERIAAQWDGCVAHQLDTFGPVDIGASIRAGELVEPAQQAEPVDGACLHGVDDGACKECYAANAEPVEPVAWVKEDVCDGQYIDGRPRKIWWECNKGVGTAFYTAPPQRTMVPVQEPVAWMIWTHGPVRVFINKDEANLEFDRLNHAYPEPTRMLVPLYTTPPQRTMVPLTEEEIYRATGHCGVSRYTAINITRAVEQAHGIKE
jgi:hypothetical protein